MGVRVAINGFGRIGRAAFRAAHESGADIDWVAINDVVDPAMLAQLLKYDTVYGPVAGDVEADDEVIVVDGERVAALAERDPARLPWEDLDVDVVMSRRACSESADAGSISRPVRARSIVSAPAKEPTPHSRPRRELRRLLTRSCTTSSRMASCTTNCAPVAQVLHDALGIRHGQMTTVHAYTGDQQLLDARTRRLPPSAAAAANLVPYLDGRRKAIGLVVPELADEAAGIAVRVCSDRVARRPHRRVERPTTVEEVNAAVAARADAAPCREFSLQRGAARLRPTSSSHRTPRSSTRRRRGSWTGRWSGSWPGTTTSGVTQRKRRACPAVLAKVPNGGMTAPALRVFHRGSTRSYRCRPPSNGRSWD
jgi:glyceraldehyde 3-phosphate dehydrogenase